MKLDGIRYPVALAGEKLVWATDLADAHVHPEGLACVGCAAPVGVRFGPLVRPHFAHRPGIECIGATETVLHATAVTVIAEQLAALSAAGIAYPVHWPCATCGHRNTGNLTRNRPISAAVNKALCGRRPDVAALDSSGTPLYVIEVVVTHAPEPESIEAYRDAGIAMVVVRPTWESLDELRAQVNAADVVGARCRGVRHRPHADPPACRECGRDTRWVAIEVLAGMTCNNDRCGAPVPVVEAIDYGNRKYPEGVAVSISDQTMDGVEPAIAAMNLWPLAIATTYNKTQQRQMRMHHHLHFWRTGSMWKLANFHIENRPLTPDTSHPWRLFAVCGNKHWTLVDERQWSDEHAYGRFPRSAAERTGKPTSISTRSAVRRMLGLS